MLKRPVDNGIEWYYQASAGVAGKNHTGLVRMLMLTMRALEG